MTNPIISEFGMALLFILAGVSFLCFTFFVSRLLRPNKPNEEKLSTYESGEEPIGNANVQFNVRFYVIALIFLLFEVEIVFLFPWATVFGQASLIQQSNGLWGWFSLFEVSIFVLILALGLVYAWVKGHLEWQKPEPQINNVHSPVPDDLYQKVNQKYA